MLRYELSDSECAMTKAIAAIEQPVFIKRKHELSDVLKQVEAGSKEAVKLLVDTMNSTEDKVALKTRLECATKLLDLQVKLAETISKDQLTRQIAEIKAKGMSVPLALEGNSGQPTRSAPRLDFSNVQSVE